jgi:glycosyltransferase involved in cell wall biosynthesis
MSTPVVSIVIPAYNRLEPLKATLHSAATALQRFGDRGEIILVDDGSTPPLQEVLRDLSIAAELRHLRQVNAGSIVARQTGLSYSEAEYVLFLDSDDLVPPDKLTVQIDEMRRANLDVCYGDMAAATCVTTTSPEVRFSPGEVLPLTSDPAEFYLRVQPAPHNPVYRREYLSRNLQSPLVPPSRPCDPAGDVWLYYNLCAFPARIGKVAAPVAAGGVHEEERYSRHWEKLGLASLHVMEGFAERCPISDQTVSARMRLGECAFRTWRGLPRGMPGAIYERLLLLWRKAPRSPLERLGGSTFQQLARGIGPLAAGRLLRWRNARYDSVRTLSDAELTSLLSSTT